MNQNPSDQNSKLVVAKNDRYLNMSSLVSSTFVTLTSHTKYINTNEETLVSQATKRRVSPVLT
jgi:hypothetical protein